MRGRTRGGRIGLFAAAALGLCLSATVSSAQSGATLSYAIVDGASIPDPLADVAGNVERGQALFADPAAGGCAECHAAPGVEAAQGKSGPPLDGVGARLSASAIRLWIVNPRALVEDSAMPAYYSLDPQAASPGADEDEGLRAEPRLDGASIEDLVAFLESLK